MSEAIWLRTPKRPWHQVQNRCPVRPGWHTDSPTKVQSHGSSEAVPDDAIDALSGGDEVVVGLGGLPVSLAPPGVVEGDLRCIVEPITRSVASRDVEVARRLIIGRRTVGICGLESFFV
jgi:hypothetical protein